MNSDTQGSGVRGGRRRNRRLRRIMRASAIGLIALLASLTACDTGVGSTTRVFPNVNPSPAPSDTHYNDQWALPLLSAREAWG
ncbi:MAG: hypothetical protein ACLFQZ_05860, partial [Spirochaetaceae bacterium]